MKTTKALRPPFKIHGGKWYLKSFVIEHFPENYENMTYLEPFIGAGSVLLNKNKSVVEVANDIDLGAIQIHRAIRDEPKAFLAKLKKVKYNEKTFETALQNASGTFDDYLDHATNDFILRRMSRGGLKKTFAWSDRKRGDKPGDVNAWETILDDLVTIAKRICDIRILNKPAIETIKAFDDENTLVYCDPPYLPDTRISKSAYEFEMSTDDHIALGELLLGFRGKAMISGYPSTLYNKMFKEWKCVKKKVANHSSQQKTKTKKVECVWFNY